MKVRLYYRPCRDAQTSTRQNAVLAAAFVLCPFVRRPVRLTGRRRTLCKRVTALPDQRRAPPRSAPLRCDRFDRRKWTVHARRHSRMVAGEIGL